MLSKTLAVAERELFALVSERSDLLEQAGSLRKERDSLPRNDKAGAHRLLQEINAIEAKAKALRLPLSEARAAVDRSDRHGMWVDSVRELFGDEGVVQCFALMKEMRKRRAATQEPQ